MEFSLDILFPEIEEAEQVGKIRKMVDDLRGRQPILTQLRNGVAHIGFLSPSHLYHEDASTSFPKQEEIKQKQAVSSPRQRVLPAGAPGRILKRSRGGLD